MFHKYVNKRQTYSDLSEEYSKSIKWIYTQIHSYKVAEKTHRPRAINLVCDTTFYGKRQDKLGTVVFFDSIEKEVLLWNHVESEKAQHYKELLKELLLLGYTINSVTIDGKRGLYTVFKAYPVQMCHFHQKKTIRRYITKNPKLDASKDLKKILYNLTKTNENNFKVKLQNWHVTHSEFLNEKTINGETGKFTFTHYKLRAAYMSLCSNFDHLFTYKNDKNLDIPNTTKKKVRTTNALSRVMNLKSFTISSNVSS